MEPTSAIPPEDEAGVRRRPKDRKAQIAKASADAFGSQGYHAVSMEEIANRVGISPAALYRHSPSKYDLFRDAVLALGQLLVDATAFVDERVDADPAGTLRDLVGALAETTVANRTAGGLYRWEARYLRGDDLATLADQIKVVNHRLQRPLAKLHPTLSSADRWTLAAATLSVIGSITDHTEPLAIGEIPTCAVAMASDVLSADIRAPRRRPPSPHPPTLVGPAAGTYEQVLHESVQLFFQRGYKATGMEDIAAAVGSQASGLYRLFPSKADILALAFRRAIDRHSGDLAEITSSTDDPREALSALITTYVDRVTANPGLAYVCYTERHNVPDSDLRALAAVEQSMVEAWARLAVAARPSMRLRHARYAVHAAFALTVDLGRLVSFDTNPDAVETLRVLMHVAVLGAAATGRGRRGKR